MGITAWENRETFHLRITQYAPRITSPMQNAWPNRIISFLSMAGAGISGYLTLAHLRAVELGCSKIHGCEEVAQHWSAKGFGIPALQAIPTAAFGILMYLALLALAFMRAAADSVERD